MRTFLACVLVLATLDAQAAQFRPTLGCSEWASEAWVNQGVTIRFDGEEAIVTDGEGERRYQTGGAGTGIPARVAVRDGELFTHVYGWDGDVLIWDGAEFRPECR